MTIDDRTLQTEQFKDFLSLIAGCERHVHEDKCVGLNATRRRAGNS